MLNDARMQLIADCPAVSCPAAPVCILSTGSIACSLQGMPIKGFVVAQSPVQHLCDGRLSIVLF